MAKIRKTRSDKVTFSEKDLEKIEKLAGLGFTVEEIAVIFGVSKHTLYRRAKETGSQINETIYSGRLKAIGNVAAKAYELSLEGNTAMIKYFLSCRGGWVEKSQVINSLERGDPHIRTKEERDLELNKFLESMPRGDRDNFMEALETIMKAQQNYNEKTGENLELNVV